MTRIGSLCSGYGGLELGLRQVVGGTVAWQCENDRRAAKVLAAHYPDVPNYGDITTTDWTQVEPVDWLTAGFPCQDLSHAGKRAGIKPGNRSGLWFHVAYVISQLRPANVLIENVRGLLSGRADRTVEPDDADVGDTPGDAGRAIGVVLGDLADLGYHATWTVVRASDAGAPHGRARVFVVARDTEIITRYVGINDGAGKTVGDSSWTGKHAGRTCCVASDADDQRRQWAGVTRDGRRGPTNDTAPDADVTRPQGCEPASRRHLPDGCTPADSSGDGRDEGRPEPARVVGGPDAAERGPTPVGQQRVMGNLSHAADTETRSDQALRDMRSADDPQTLRPQSDARGHGAVHVAADLLPVLREHQVGGDEGHASLAGTQAPQTELRDVRDDDRSTRPSSGPGSHEQRPDESTDPLLILSPETALVGGQSKENARSGATAQAGPAVRGVWAAAPSAPSQGADLLTSVQGDFAESPNYEFLMGLPAGWVTGVDIPRNAQLKILGNGVVPQQCALAVRTLLDLEARWVA